MNFDLSTPEGRIEWLRAGSPETPAKVAGNGAGVDVVAEEPASGAGEVERIDTVFDDENLRADFGNVARFLNAYRSTTRYVYARKKFLCFDECRWSDNQGLVEDRANRIVQALRDVIGKTKEDDQQAFKHYIKSQSPERRNAMLTLARAEIRIEADAFDADPELFNVSNGTIHLPTGEFRKHDPGDYCSKISGVKFDKDAKCSLWLEFLKGIFNGDQALIDFIKRACGYSLSGLTIEQVLFLLYGIGKNGKSTFLNVLKRLLGEYATHAQMETFSAQNRAGAGHREDLARLCGARLVTAVESQESRRLDEGLIKQATGCDSITASRKHEHEITFPPLFKLWLAVNHKPIIRGTDDGIWRRPLLIPFTVQFEKDPSKVKEGKKLADTRLEAKLLAELPGILNWGLEGFREWNDDGLNPPASVVAATEQYREESDLLGAFIVERLIQRKDKTRKGEYATPIYQDYCDWCEKNGERALSQTTFGTRMVERGFRKEKDSTKVVYLDLFLAATDDGA